MADTKKKNQNSVTRQNVLESLKDLGTGTTSQATDFLKNTSEDFIRELLGFGTTNVKRSGELNPGESVEMKDILSGKEKQIKSEEKQIKFEKTLLNEESRVTREKTQQLRVELQALMQEVQKVAESTQTLAEITHAATFSAPIEPGIYHINFFQNLLTFLRSFRQRIDLAATWLQGTNKRAEKKNFWAQYNKKGTSFLLNPESYSQRSAG